MGGFPRHLTTQLIEEGEGERSRREVLGGLLLGLGLAVFALAFPQERLIGQQVQHMDPADAMVQYVVDYLRGLSIRHLAMMPEQLGFVLAALAYGACLPVSLAIARRQGCGFGLALVGSLAVLLSPVAWVAGTTPGLEAFALLFSLLCLHALWGHERPKALMATSWWALSAACTPANAWLLPAVVRASLRSQKKRFELGFSLPLIGITLFLLFSIPVGVLLDVEEALTRVWRAMLFGGSGGWGQIVSWVLGLGPGLGLAVVGVGSLFLLKRGESEARPPRWLLLWCALPALAVGLGGTPEWSIPYLWLVPPALIGTCDLLARRADDIGLGWGVGILSLQVLAVIAAAMLLMGTDPQREWRTTAQARLQPGDYLFTASRERAYLAANRWGLSCALVTPALGRAADEGKQGAINRLDDLGEFRAVEFEWGAGSWGMALADDCFGQRVVLDTPYPVSLSGFEDAFARAYEKFPSNRGILRLDEPVAQ